MLRLSKWSCVLLSGAVALACVGMPGAARVSLAQTEPAVDPKLRSEADDLLHYSLVNNVELAKANGEALLASGATPRDLLFAFEAAANERNPREVLTQNLRREELKDVSRQLLDKIEEGFRAVARDPLRIRAEVDRLGGGLRAQANAKTRLIDAGQFAAPIFFEYLQNNQKKDLHPYILQIMGEPEMGRALLLPLLEQLRTSDPQLRIDLVRVIGKIGYSQALPTLRALQQDSATAGELKIAVDDAIAACDTSHGNATKFSASDLTLKAGENYYEKKPSYQPLLADEKTNPVWVFDKGLNNVAPLMVPTVIWNDVMALRLAEATLRSDANNGDAISLWLAATLRREQRLPEGAKDPTHDDKSDAGAFYARAFGPIYVNPVLSRALDAHDSALAMKAIDALEATGGVTALVSNPNGAALVRALSYPDRAVRFRAAFALARANPTSQFPSYYRVVPILAEAVNSSATPTALVVSSSEDGRNHLSEMLRNGSGHFSPYGGETLSAALDAAKRAPAIDVVIVTEPETVAQIQQLARNEYRLAGVPILVAAPAANLNNLKMQFAQNKGVGIIDEKADDAAIQAALGTARTALGNAPLSAEAATAFAATSLELLGMLAADHKSIYPMTEAIPTLVDAIKDKRPEIATAAAGVAGKLTSAEAEKALAMAATSDADAALRIAYFNALAESAKRTGNQLDAPAVNAIIAVVLSDADPKIRVAAATALGALNVPSNQASTLILKQSK